MSANDKKKKVVKKERVHGTDKIEFKNYIYAVLILIIGILLVLYIFKWLDVKKEEKLMNSYLISSNTITSTITDVDSLKQILLETPDSYFIYFGYTGDEDVYELEKEMKSVIDDYNLSDMFYYFDITDIRKDNDDYIATINNALGINYLENVPAIIYVHEGEIIERNVLDGINNTMLKVADLENLLDIYDYEVVD